MSGKPEIVCVIDDDTAVRNALKFLLEVEGMTVRTYDGPISLLADRNLPPCACIIVDHDMPVMNGLEMLTVLRSRGAMAPAILITGHGNTCLQKLASPLGVRRILEKPLLHHTLVESIRAALAPH